MVNIVPTILTQDLSQAQTQLQSLLGLVKDVHLDVLDGRFAPNLTFNLKKAAELKLLPKFNLFLHLMVEDALAYLTKNGFFKTGQNVFLPKKTTVIIHREKNPFFKKTLAVLKDKGFKIGIALDTESKVDDVSGSIFAQVDFVLLLMVKAGFSGQKFIPSRLNQVKILDKMRFRNSFKFKIGLDGGIGKDNIRDCVQAGAQVLFVHTSLWQNNKAAQNLKNLKKLIHETRQKPNTFS